MSAGKLVVLDAWPVVEYYEGDNPSARAVEGLIDDDSATVVISSVNVAEAYRAVASDVGEFSEAQSFIWGLNEVVSVLGPTFEIAELAALLKHCFHMSLGDSFAAATSIACSSGPWPSRAHDESDEEPESYVELWTGDAELLCEDRIWRVRDFRAADQKRAHDIKIEKGSKQVGLRPDLGVGRSLLHFSTALVSSAQRSLHLRPGWRRSLDRALALIRGRGL